MDTQDSLKIFIGYKEIEFYLSKLPNKTILFEFNENALVNVITNTNKYRVCIERGEKFSDTEFKYLSEIKPNYKYQISDNQNSYYPSIYLIRIEDKFTRVVTYKHFRVKPMVALDKNDMFSNMREVISNFSKSFLYDYSNKKYVSSIETEMHKGSIIDKCKLLTENESLITSALLNIKNNPVLNLDKRIIKSQIPGKQTSKTLVKNIIKNDFNYKIKTVENYNCKENSTLNFYLSESHILLVNFNDQIDYYIFNYEKMITNYNKAINNTNKSFKKSRLIEELERTISKLNLFKQCKILIDSIIYKIINLQYNSFLKDISIKEVALTDRFLMNQNYSIIYNKLYKILEEKGYDNDVAFNTSISGYSYKSTSVLYEIYCLLFMLRVIEDAGFVLDPSKNEFNIEDLSIIESDSSFDYTNGKYKCKVIYDRKVLNFNDDSKREDELITFVAHHDQPDFQILFFDDNDEYLDGIILDSKCRRFDNIQLTDENPLINTILDYMQFRYLKINDKLINSKIAVSNLILFCPDINLNQVFVDNKYGVKYLPLKPSINIDDNVCYSYFSSLIDDELSKFDKMTKVN